MISWRKLRGEEVEYFAFKKGLEILSERASAEPKWIPTLWSAVERLSIEAEACWPTQHLMDMLVEVSVESILVSV